MGQKITEYPQVDLWLRHTREADKAGATLPYRESSDVRELSKYAEMEKARHRSVFFSGWSAPEKPVEKPVEEPKDTDEGGEHADSENA